MSSLWRDPRTGVYQVHVYVDGVRFSRSTGHRSKRRARAAQDRIVAELHGELSAAGAPSPEVYAATLGGAVDWYLELRARNNLAPLSLRTYRSSLGRYLDFAGARARIDSRPPDEPQRFAAWYDARPSRGSPQAHASTVAGRLRHVALFWRTAAEHGLAPPDHPWQGATLSAATPRVAHGSKSIKWLQPPARRILAAHVAEHGDLWDRLILSLGMHHGLRRGEMAQIAPGWLGESGSRALLRLRETKSCRAREVPCAPSFLELLPELDLRGPRLLPFGTFIIWQRVSRWKAALGFEALSPHVLRHTYARSLYERGVFLPVIQQLMGHRSINTTMIYTAGDLPFAMLVDAVDGVD